MWRERQAKPKANDITDQEKHGWTKQRKECQEKLHRHLRTGRNNRPTPPGTRATTRRAANVGASAVISIAMGMLIFGTATGSGYSGAVAFEDLMVASAAALVGSVVLMLKPPAARRIAAVLLVTAYPVVLFGLGWAGSMLSSGATRWVVVKAARAATGWFA